MKLEARPSMMYCGRHWARLSQTYCPIFSLDMFFRNTGKKNLQTGVYREVQLDSTPEIEVFHTLFERCQSKNGKISIKQHI